MRTKYIIGLVIIAGAFFYLVWTSFKASFQFALSPSEFLAAQSEYAGKAVKITGTVAGGSLSVKGTEHLFDVTDGGQTIKVHYKGVVPNTFKEGADVVVSGKFGDGASVFEATQIMAKCGSKYEVK